MRNAGDAPEGRRTAARLDVARFYLARDMHAEAKGVLDVTIAAEHDSHELATAFVLRGVANLGLGRAEQTLKDLASPVVGNQHNAPLWRGVALSRLGRFTEARQLLKDTDGAATQLPVELQRVVLHEAARCAVEVGDLAEAARRLSELETLGVPGEMRPAVSLLAGRLAEHFRLPDEALAAYRVAADSRDQPRAAEARLRAVTLRRTLRKVPNDDAIAELELLTAAWRGDDTEAEAMRQLARLYRDEGRHRDAFHLMRVALTAHARSPVTRRIQDEAAVAFEALFLGGQGSDLPAIEALGLFYDFRSLTPPGRRGDEMIRRLAERLIAMDLLSQAGELLQHQIDNRLQGAARAHVAARLAMVYLMNRRPDAALTALRSTRLNDLPRDVRQQRLLLEARALSDSGRHDLALEITSEMEGAEVGRLRADIHWAARQWREAAEAIERLYGERWRSTASLEVTERTDILRAAIGYALAEDMLGLDRFREKYRTKMSETPDARMFEVVTAPLNARAPEFAEIARAASSVDTLGAFLRDLRARYPDNGAVSAGASPGSG
jgi:tetratricopeptide (TPR) repeat protein